MSEYLDNNAPDPMQMYDKVNLNKAVRISYAQLYDEGSSNRIVAMFDDHKLLTKEEEDNDTH